MTVYMNRNKALFSMAFILAKIMQLYMPECIKKKKLFELFRLTALAFQSKLPGLRGFSYAQCLSKYALFTKEQSKNYLRGGHLVEVIKHRLYHNSYIYGQNLRKSLHITTREEVLTLLSVIYKFINIDFHYDGHGEIIMKQCYFSTFYSKEVCMLISSLDEGLAAGLSDGGRLCFTQRITEGNTCCKGYFDGGFQNEKSDSGR